MLATVDVTERLASQVARWVLHPRVNVEELLALETIQEKSPEALVEVLLQTLDDFLKNLELDAAHLALSSLRLVELVENDTSRLYRWELNQLKVLGDVLPVVY